MQILALSKRWYTFCCCSVDKSSLTPWSHELQHARLLCYSLSPRVCSTHVHWASDAIQPPHLCCPILLPSVFPRIRSFPMSQPFTSGGQSIGASASTISLPMHIQCWFPLGLTGLISLQSQGLSRVFSNITVQKHQFFGVPAFFMVQLSHHPMTSGKTIVLTIWTFVDKVMSLLLICCLDLS